MSASHTGELPFLVQVLSSRPNIPSASAPASRTASMRTRERALGSASGSMAGNGHPFHPQRGRVGAVTEHEIVRGLEGTEHLDQISRDGHLADRVGELAVLDPEPGGAATVIAGHEVDPHSDQVGDVEALAD